MKSFKVILRSLIKNDATVEGGRHHPWWIALILFFVSAVLSIVPIFVQTISKNGSDFVANATRNLDTSLFSFIEDAQKSDISFVIKELEDGSKYLESDTAKWDATYVATNKDGYHCYQHKTADNQIDLDVFYVPDLTNAVITSIANDAPVTNEETGEVTYTKRDTSFMIFGKREMVVILYVKGNTSAVGSLYGDYKNLDADYNILSSLSTVTVEDQTVTFENVTPTTFQAFKEGVWKNAKAFFDKAYLYNKGQLTWRTTLLMFGINVVLVLFMGLMIFILTRGKANPFRIYTFMECQFIAYWASLSPAILSLILGFVFSSFAQMMFALLVGVRVMWLSMKTLRPEYSATPQQNTKKVVKTVEAKESKPNKKK